MFPREGSESFAWLDFVIGIEQEAHLMRARKTASAVYRDLQLGAWRGEKARTTSGESWTMLVDIYQTIAHGI